MPDNGGCTDLLLEFSPLSNNIGDTATATRFLRRLDRGVRRGLDILFEMQPLPEKIPFEAPKHTENYPKTHSEEVFGCFRVFYNCPNMSKYYMIVFQNSNNTTTTIGFSLAVKCIRYLIDGHFVVPC